MPNLDGGHYFLTVLAPVRVDTMVDRIVGHSLSHAQLLVQKLALLPTGRQTAVSPPGAPPSPFAANTLNHFARFAFISGPHFNGRVSGDAIVAAATSLDPLKAQPVDQFPTPYLLFAAEFDGQGKDAPTALRDYAEALWATMRQDLQDVFGHCVGFEGIETAERFHHYLRRCQVETTVPFNDYWAHGLSAAAAKPPIWPAALAGGAFLLGFVVWLLAAIVHGFELRAAAHRPVAGWLARWVARAVADGVVILPILAVLTGLALWYAVAWVYRRARPPFPTAPGSDLRTILKALFLQQRFTELAIETQGLDDAALHARFGDFLAAVRPDQAAPAQVAGECHAAILEPTA
ncbi:hypothetical protein [Phenylobacterium sp.]|uniref:hypothetical protein n=1 Tax=Phenylobacterium sp. TaxID=1871053 RepID=UPI002DEA78E0|nr:hypothetical protein [Phenylobacterium sp.]